MTSVEKSKLTVRRYLEEVLDNGRVEVLDELFAQDCVIHRPEFPEPITGLENFKAFLLMALDSIFCSMKTTVHEMFTDGELLCCRLSHEAVFCDGAVYPSRIGAHEAGGRKIVWKAMAMCRMENGKIKEEWVYKDEIGLLHSLGVFQHDE